MLNRQFPLTWPADEPRTPDAQRRTASQFKVAPDRALRDLYQELKRFKATNVVLSSNVPVRTDGSIYADAARRRMDDAAVALYFELGARKIAICCDLYFSVNDNIRALYKVVEGMRTIERFGGQRISEKTFTGFAALPPPPDVWKTLGISKGIAEALNDKMRREYVMDAFRNQVKDGHGAGQDMAALTEARDQALRQLGVS
jgi:hypothetical protein